MDLLKELHFNGWWIVALPTMLMGLDIMTGLIYAWTSKTFQSSKMRTGLGKKFGEMAYIVIGIAATVAMDLPQYILCGIAAYIIFMELLSIMENCDKLGAPVPKFVKTAFATAETALQSDSYAELMAKLSKMDKAQLEEVKKLLSEHKEV